jgi:hypothetical protein
LGRLAQTEIDWLVPEPLTSSGDSSPSLSPAAAVFTLRRFSPRREDGLRGPVAKGFRRSSSLGTHRNAAWTGRDGAVLSRFDDVYRALGKRDFDALGIEGLLDGPRHIELE